LALAKRRVLMALSTQMKDINSPLRTALGVVVSLAAAVTLTLASAGAEAGIFRDMMSSVGLSKPAPPPSDANGVPSYPRQGYACCNLHYNKDWIADTNYAELPLIAAGTPIEVVKYGSNRAEIKIDGKPLRLGHDYGRAQEALDEWVRKIVVNDDPKGKINAYPAATQEAIRLGKVMIGMTREQCIVAVGYPLTNENVTLDAATWRMWRSSGGEYQLNFSRDGHLTSVTGDVETTYAMTYKPGR
jgi:hypothetical protein